MAENKCEEIGFAGGGEMPQRRVNTQAVMTLVPAGTKQEHRHIYLLWSLYPVIRENYTLPSSQATDEEKSALLESMRATLGIRAL